MTINRRTRMLGAAALFACSPLAVMAQTTGPTTPSTPDRPSATEPARPTDPAMKPTEPARPALPRTTQQTAPKVNPLIGLAVFSSDGSKLGNVHSVNAEPDGKVKAIHIKTGVRSASLPFLHPAPVLLLGCCREVVGASGLAADR